MHPRCFRAHTCCARSPTPVLSADLPPPSKGPRSRRSSCRTRSCPASRLLFPLMDALHLGLGDSRVWVLFSTHRGGLRRCRRINFTAHAHVQVHTVICSSRSTSGSFTVDCLALPDERSLQDLHFPKHIPACSTSWVCMGTSSITRAHDTALFGADGVQHWVLLVLMLHWSPSQPLTMSLPDVLVHSNLTMMQVLLRFPKSRCTGAGLPPYVSASAVILNESSSAQVRSNLDLPRSECHQANHDTTFIKDRDRVSATSRTQCTFCATSPPSILFCFVSSSTR